MRQHVHRHKDKDYFVLCTLKPISEYYLYAPVCTIFNTLLQKYNFFAVIVVIVTFSYFHIFF